MYSGELSTPGGSTCSVCAHFQCPPRHLHQTKVVSIHPQRNSKQVPWFTTAPSACCCHEGRGGCLPLPFLLAPLFSVSQPQCSLPSSDNEADFYAALVLCCSGEMNGLTEPSEERHSQLRPGSRAGSGRGRGMLEKRALVLRCCQGPAPLSHRTCTLTASFFPGVPARLLMPLHCETD